MHAVDEELENAVKRGWRIQVIQGLAYAADRAGDPEQLILGTPTELVARIRERDTAEGRLPPG
jgi:hypothetical protein